MILNPYPGIFIVFDGNDGCGKTAQIKKALAWLHSLDILRHAQIVETKEPNKLKLFGKKIYEDLAKESGLHTTDRFRFQSWYACDSKEHLISTVVPALETDAIVLSDRFRSSMVYGAGSEEGIDELMQMNREILGEHFIWPDITIIFDVPVEISISRLEQKGIKLDGHERHSVLRRVRKNFLAFAKKYPDCKVLDATAPIDEVHENVKSILLPLIKSKKHIPV